MYTNINRVAFTSTPIYDEEGNVTEQVTRMCKVNVTYTYTADHVATSDITLFPLTDKNIQMGIYNTAFNKQADKSEAMKQECIDATVGITLASLEQIVQDALEAEQEELT